MEYTLSFYTKVSRPKIEYPKWFEVWKRAELTEYKIWIRKVILIESDNPDAIDIFNSNILREVIKLSHQDSICLQLELGEDFNTNYINCSELTTETPKLWNSKT